MTEMNETARRLIEIERSKKVLAEARVMFAANEQSKFLRLVVAVMEGRVERIARAGSSFET